MGNAPLLILAACTVLSFVCGCRVQPEAVGRGGGGTGQGYIITTSTGVPARRPDPGIEYKNLYGICWTGDASGNLRYARNMGYKYVVYQDGMETDPSSAGMSFYVESPRYVFNWSLLRDFCIRPDRSYAASEKTAIERWFAWKSDGAFPRNIATGWFFNERDFTPQPDFQQQAVIDRCVGAAVDFIKGRENPEKGFLFAGVTWDVPLLAGDFWSGLSTGGGAQVTLAYWTGSDSSVLHGGITHEYATYTEGMAAYYKSLKKRLGREFPGRRLRYMMEPYAPYEDWMKPLELREDRDELLPDLLFQEGHDLAFAEDPRIFASGLVSRDRAGCTTPDVHDEPRNRLIAAKAAVQGSWFTWYGRFGGTGDMIDYRDISEVPAWLKLVRVVANWDNLAGVPLEKRSWDGKTYQSPNSRMDGRVIETRNPYTGELFVVFLDKKGKAVLRPWETVVSVRRADAYFGAAGDGSGDLLIDGAEVRPR